MCTPTNANMSECTHAKSLDFCCLIMQHINIHRFDRLLSSLINVQHNHSIPTETGVLSCSATAQWKFDCTECPLKAFCAHGLLRQQVFYHLWTCGHNSKKKVTVHSSADRQFELTVVFAQAFSRQISHLCSHYPPNYGSQSLWHNQQSATSVNEKAEKKSSSQISWGN